MLPITLLSLGLTIGLTGCLENNLDPEPPPETVEWETLELAVRGGDTGTVAEYLDKYQDLLTMTGPRGWYLIHHAAAAGSEKMLQFLVERGADINARTRYNETAWAVAEDHGVDEAVLAYIESVGGAEY